MILYLDTEFSSLEAPALISIALVSERDQTDFFYAELPAVDYLDAASAWVRDNVMPLLWGGSWVISQPEIPARLVAWIEAHDERCMIVTDAPEYDFALIKPLLEPWPKNLAKQPMRFDSLAMGVNRQARLLDVRTRFHKENRAPEHHALCDAQALRAAMLAALEAGWKPRTNDDWLGALADAAIASTTRAGAAIDDAVAFVEESNKRIDAMEAEASNNKGKT